MQKSWHAISDLDKRTDRLTELNVKEQVMHLAKTSIIQRAWKYDRRPQLHGWVYGLRDGLINPSSTWTRALPSIRSISMMICNI